MLGQLRLKESWLKKAQPLMLEASAGLYRAKPGQRRILIAVEA
jgi:hypothetical protein